MRDGDKDARHDLEGGVTIKQVCVAIGLVFAITLAVVVGKQMSTDAMAVVVGVACGVAAGIPTSVLLLVALTRRERRRAEDAERQMRQAERSFPPVIVIQGGAPQALPAGYWPSSMPWQANRREFHVVGGDDLLADDQG
jgi:protein-disulfide isomerase-like protein with CxxC motif